jgi:hypothetical protein
MHNLGVIAYHKKEYIEAAVSVNGRAKVNH